MWKIVKDIWIARSVREEKKAGGVADVAVRNIALAFRSHPRKDLIARTHFRVRALSNCLLSVWKRALAALWHIEIYFRFVPHTADTCVESAADSPPCSPLRPSALYFCYGIPSVSALRKCNVTRQFFDRATSARCVFMYLPVHSSYSRECRFPFLSRT